MSDGGFVNPSDDMRPEDVGLSGDMPFFDPESAIKTTPRVSYTTIYKCDNFSVR